MQYCIQENHSTDSLQLNKSRLVVGNNDLVIMRLFQEPVAEIAAQANTPPKK